MAQSGFALHRARCLGLVLGLGLWLGLTGASAQPVAPSECAGTLAAPTPSLRINPDLASVSLAQGGVLPPRQLALRAGLLSPVHYLPDGRHALLLTRSAWVLRVDLACARLVAEVRVGVQARGAALSAARPGLPSLLAVANAEPPTLVVLDEQLARVRQLPVVDATGRSTSGVAAIRTAPARSSFVATLADAPELWELSYNPLAPEISVGWVHDFQYREGQFVPGYLNPQRSSLPSPAQDLWLTDAGHEVLTLHAAPPGDDPQAGVPVQVTHLDVRRKIAELRLPKGAVVGEAAYGRARGVVRVLVPHAGSAWVSVIDPERWVLLEPLHATATACLPRWDPQAALLPAQAVAAPDAPVPSGAPCAP